MTDAQAAGLRWSIMAALARLTPQGVTRERIANTIGAHDMEAVGDQLADLERQGMVARSPAQADRRWWITKAGLSRTMARKLPKEGEIIDD